MSARLRFVLCTVLLVVLAFPTVAMASSENYSITIPATGNVYTKSYSLNYGYDFGVRHRYSGGKDIVMQIVNASTYSGIGPSEVVSPGGDSAPLTHLWYNNTYTRTVRVRLNSAIGVVVTVLAQGTWYWNY